MEDDRKELTTPFATTFDECISLYKLVPTQAIQTLKIVTESYYNQGRSDRAPSVLITCPENGLGAEAISRAYSNSFGNNFVIGIAEAFSAGADIRAFFTEAPPASTFYLSACDKLNMFNQTVVHKILTSNVVDVPDSYTRRLKPVYLDSPLIILSAREPRSLTYELRKSLDVHIELHPLNQSHIIKILKLKCQFYGFKASQSAIELIASNAMGNPNRAVRILLLGRDIMESEEKNKISAETARKAIVLTV